MKKGVVAALVIIALIVIVSPGIVGRLAEKSVDEQLKWASDENREIVITSEKFDRGWFSSAGRHRIAFGSSGAGADLKRQLGFAEGESTPALIIDTRIDHGLIPVGSINHDDTSLAPGLGHAESTISIESADGRITRLPGVVRSDIGLDGALVSAYLLEAGSAEDVSWGAADVSLNADARGGHFAIDGDIESLGFVSPDGHSVKVGRLAVASDMAMSGFGYAVGELDLTLASMNIVSDVSNLSFGPLKIDAASMIEDDRLNIRADMEFAMADVVSGGDVGWSFDLVVNALDAAAAGRLQRAVDQARTMRDRDALYAYVEKDLMDVVASGFELRFEQLDVTLPQGTVVSKLSFELPPTDRKSFAWTGVLLDLKATAEIRVPAAVYEFVSAMNPQVNMAVAMGFLKKTGDDYEMAAEYKKGLLTVNGAPMPIPMPSM